MHKFHRAAVVFLGLGFSLSGCGVLGTGSEGSASGSGSAIVTGMVQLKGLTQHAGIEVVIAGGNDVLETETDAAGMFRFENVADGPYELVATAGDYTREKVVRKQFTVAALR